jgi:hypothetical protein
MNQPQALAMKGWKSKLFSQQGRVASEKFALGLWASRRRSELLELLDPLNPSIEELTTARPAGSQQVPRSVAADTRPLLGVNGVVCPEYTI